MKVGDLVRPTWEGLNGDRVGIVVEIHYRVVPTVVVQWSGLEGKLPYRIDMLEVLSESR